MPETGLPAGWEIRHSKSRNLPYYFNAARSESRWEPPADTDSDVLSAYMATYHSAPKSSGGAPAATGKIRASHLLIKHKDSRRPSSWREVAVPYSSVSFTRLIVVHRPPSHAPRTTRCRSCSRTRTRSALATPRSASWPRPRATARRRAKVAISVPLAKERCKRRLRMLLLHSRWTRCLVRSRLTVGFI